MLNKSYGYYVCTIISYRNTILYIRHYWIRKTNYYTLKFSFCSIEGTNEYIVKENVSEMLWSSCVTYVVKWSCHLIQNVTFTMVLLYGINQIYHIYSTHNIHNILSFLTHQWCNAVFKTICHFGSISSTLIWSLYGGVIQWWPYKRI